MSWHYKIIKETDKLGGPFYALVEYYPDLRSRLLEDPGIQEVLEDTGSPDAWGEAIIVGNSKKEIRRQLLQMLIDTL